MLHNQKYFLNSSVSKVHATQMLSAFKVAQSFENLPIKKCLNAIQKAVFSQASSDYDFWFGLAASQKRTWNVNSEIIKQNRA